MIDKEELHWALKRLEGIGQRLKVIALAMLTLTLFNTSIMFSFVAGMLYINIFMIFALSSLLTFIVFFFALYFDSMRKDGRAYYDEVTGALHQTSKIDDEAEFRQDSIMARVAIRKFINSVDIPLIPGNFGPGLLVLLNIVITISIVFVRSAYT